VRQDSNELVKSRAPGEQGWPPMCHRQASRLCGLGHTARYFNNVEREHVLSFPHVRRELMKGRPPLGRSQDV
jgi:hypothetical protein